MAGSRIKGIMVEIGGDTTGLDKALKSVCLSKQLVCIEAYLRELRSGLY